MPTEKTQSSCPGSGDLNRSRKGLKNKYKRLLQVKSPVFLKTIFCRNPLTNSQHGDQYLSLTDLMFSFPWIAVYQFKENNLMPFSFNLLRIKGPYMFQALLAHPQEALNKRNFLCCVLIMSAKLQPCHSQLTS
jgi:hypothetical protein